MDKDYEEGYGAFVREVAREIDCPLDNESVLYKLYVMINFIKEVSNAYDSKPDYWCSCSQCEDFKEKAEEILDNDFWRWE